MPRERWVRLFYRNGKSEAFREGPDLDRALARKVPVAVYQARALWHRCQVCGTEGVWGPDWISWPRYGPRQEARGGGTDTYCSAECCRAENADGRPPRWMEIDSEPRRPQAMRYAIYAAIRAQQQADADAKLYRRVPMPPWRGQGWCKWCDKRIDPALDPDDKHRKSWHTRCLRVYLLHSDQMVQARFLRERDGRLCAAEGCERPGEEVDHRVPLWKVRGLADAIRRAFHGPINLWLLCRQCHAAKTKAEAAERAQATREARERDPG
jgi:5-methylcytosine-specific restriction endonuclease McrA